MSRRLQCGYRHVAAGEDRRAGANTLAGKTDQDCRASAHHLPTGRSSFLLSDKVILVMIVFFIVLYDVTQSPGRLQLYVRGHPKNFIVSFFTLYTAKLQNNYHIKLKSVTAIKP